MESELRNLSGTSAHRNDALNKAAFAIGQLVGGALIEHGAAHDRLVEIAQGIGLMTPDEQKKTLSTIKHALADGMMHPRRGPEDSGDGRSGWRGSGANGAANSATAQQEGAGEREFAKRRWDAARPAGSDTPVGAYLRSRGIASPPPLSVRFHPETPMPGGSRHPALLAAITDPLSGEFLALHRIALRPDGSDKADIEPAKATLGSSRGGAVVFGRLGDGVVEGEGVETVLSAVEAGAAGIATLSASTLGRVPLPKAVTRVIILGERGSEPAAEAAARLRHAEGRSVGIVYPQPPHKDLNDLLRAEGLLAVEKLLLEVRPWDSPAEDAPDMSVAERTVTEPPVFPLEVLGPWQDWVLQAAEAKSAPNDYVAASLVTVAAAIIGATRWCEPQDGWREPSILWWMLVGSPSTNKSPSIDAVRDGLAPIEQEMFAAFEDASKKYEEAKTVAAAAEKIWEKQVEDALRKSGSPTPERPKRAERPQAPALERLTVTDATVEAAAAVLSVNRRGVLLLRDELSAWAANLEKYGGGDRAFWIEAFGGRPYTVDRKKLGAKPMFIPHLAVSVLGGIQPDRLASLVLQGDDDGLAARFLYTWPHPVPPQRPRGRLDMTRLKSAFLRLRSLAFFEVEPGKLQHATLPVENAALEEFWAWRAHHHDESRHVGGLVGSAYGKLPGLALRLATVLEHLWWAAEPDGTPEPTFVGMKALGSALDLIESYVKPMLLRVAGEAALPERDRDAAILARAILQKRPEVINAREVRREWRQPGLREPTRVDAAIAALVEARWLVAVPVPGNDPRRRRKDFRVDPRVFRGGAR
jgi:hypothetical protein